MPWCRILNQVQHFCLKFDSQNITNLFLRDFLNLGLGFGWVIVVYILMLIEQRSLSVPLPILSPVSSKAFNTFLHFWNPHSEYIRGTFDQALSPNHYLKPPVISPHFKETVFSMLWILNFLPLGLQICGHLYKAALFNLFLIYIIFTFIHLAGPFGHSDSCMK